MSFQFTCIGYCVPHVMTKRRFFEIILVLTQNQNYFKETECWPNTSQLFFALSRICSHCSPQRKLWPTQITILDNSTNNRPNTSLYLIQQLKITELNWTVLNVKTCEISCFYLLHSRRHGVTWLNSRWWLPYWLAVRVRVTDVHSAFYTQNSTFYHIPAYPIPNTYWLGLEFI